MPSAYPIPANGGPYYSQFYQLAPNFGTVKGPAFQDGGQDTFQPQQTPVRTWVIVYNQLTISEAAALDAHYASALGSQLGFSFTDPRTSTAYSNVKYLSYEVVGSTRATIQKRKVQLEKRP